MFTVDFIQNKIEVARSQKKRMIPFLGISLSLVEERYFLSVCSNMGCTIEMTKCPRGLWDVIIYL